MIPNYELQLGGVKIDQTENDDLEELNVQVSIDTPADIFTAIIRANENLSGLKTGDPASVKLGYDTDLHDSFSGQIDTVEAGFAKLRVLGLSQTVKLLRLRVNQVYLKQTAGAIVKDLCSLSKVPAGDIEDGVTLPSFVLTHEVPAYEYVKALAEKSGFDVYFTPENDLAFKEYAPENTHELESGLEILKLESAQSSPPESVKIFGESPSSVRGSDTSHWLTKDNVEGSAGTGQALSFSDPSVRDKDTANAVAKSRLADSRHAIHLSVLALGNPEIKLGDAISLKGLGHDLLKGDFKVRAVEHSLNKNSGFVTRISCSREV